MIKIGDTFPDSQGVDLTVGNPALMPLQAEQDGAFLTQLRSTRAALEGETFERLVGMIDLQAERLAKNPVPGEVALYRELIARFLKEVHAKISRTEKRHDRRNRTLSIIRTLDEKLASFTQDLLDGQLTPLEILASVNELRGMLMDLLI